MNIFVLSSLSAAAIMALLGGFVLIKAPRNPLNRAYFFFCLAVAYIGFLEFEIRTAAVAAEALRWVRASSFWTLAPAAFFHFAFLYTRRRGARRSGWIVPAIYAIALGSGFLYLTTDLLIRGVQKESWGWTASSVPSPLASVVMAAVSLIGLIPVWLCVRHFQLLKDPVERRRAGTVTLGYLVPVLFFLLTEILSPRLKLNLPEITTLGSFLGALIIWFGIWRFKLFVLSPRTAAEDIVSMMADALLLVGMDGSIRLANRSALRLLGYSEKEIVGMPIEALLAETDQYRVRGKAFLDMINTFSASDLETTLIAKGSRAVPVSMSKSVIADSHGVPQGIVMVVRDLTERRKSEEELGRFRGHLEELVEKRTLDLDQANRRLQEEIADHIRADKDLVKTTSELRAVLDALPDIYVRTDDQGIVLDYHAGNPAELGVQPEQFIGKKAQEFLPPPIIPRFERAIRKVLETKSLVTAEFSMPLPSGETIFEYRALPLFDNQVIFILRNVTQARVAAGALDKSEERFQSLFENSTIGLYRTTPDGRILLANPTLIRMLGYESLGDLNQRNLEEEGFEASYPRSAFKERIEKEVEIRGLESAWKRRDGTTIFVRESARAIRDAAGNVLYYEGTVEDITERRRAEDALMASLREKEVLLREIHHRVKNNMQIISSLLNLQAREIADPAVAQMFKESQGRIRAMAFVHERLYRSKDLSRVGLSEYIGSLLAHLSRIYLVDAARIRFETKIEDIALEISTAIPCGLLINELVTNSLKHAFPGDRAGTIRLELRRQGGDRYLLRIADDGVGFPQGVDFQMTESLGMQIILMLVDQIDGAIERESGPGTVFRIEFGEVKYRTKY